MLQGSTANFNVYYDPSLGADGVTIAKGVLASCEADYNRVKSYFGGITPPGLPFNVIIANLQGGGAYHYGCSAIDIYCDVKTTPSVDPKFTEFLNMAERSLSGPGSGRQMRNSQRSISEQHDTFLRPRYG